MSVLIKDLPKHIKTKARKRIKENRDFPAIVLKDKTTTLMCAFLWDVTPEKHDYWSNINSKYTKDL